MSARLVGNNVERHTIMLDTESSIGLYVGNLTDNTSFEHQRTMKMIFHSQTSTTTQNNGEYI